MRNTAAFPNLLRRFSLLLLCVLALVRCSVSFTSPARGCGKRSNRCGGDCNAPEYTTYRTTDGSRRRDRSRVFVSPSTGGGETREEALSKRRQNSWIVLVDDEEPIRRAVGQFFLDKGYRVTTCADGRAALEVARGKDGNEHEHGEIIARVPDCIVSDVRMPGMDGLELVRTVRKHEVLSHVPVVLLSAKATVRDRIAGYDAGADAYLTKPFSAEELVAIVDNNIERSRDIAIETEELHREVTVADLKRDVAEIKALLLHKGGGGIGNGWVRQTDVFLSKDERTVLELLSRGLITKEIAAKTHLSTRRIEQLLTGMFRKTEVKNRTELVRWAVSTGNIE